MSNTQAGFSSRAAAKECNPGPALSLPKERQNNRQQSSYFVKTFIHPVCRFLKTNVTMLHAQISDPSSIYARGRDDTHWN